MKEFLAQYMPIDASQHGPALDNLNAMIHWVMLVLFVLILRRAGLGRALPDLHDPMDFPAAPSTMAAGAGGTSHRHDIAAVQS